MLRPLAEEDLPLPTLPDVEDAAAALAVANGFLPLQNGSFAPQQTLTRQQMAGVAMQACGVNYRNASSTMPVCTDLVDVAANYGTNVARALYFGFMALDAKGYFWPNKLVTRRQAAKILDRTADFAGL